MAKFEFTGSDVRRNLPRGGLKKICDEFNLSDTWVRRILDGKVIGYDAVIERALEIIKEHKVHMEEKAAARESIVKKINKMEQTQN